MLKTPAFVVKSQTDALMALDTKETTKKRQTPRHRARTSCNVGSMPKHLTFAHPLFLDDTIPTHR